VVPIAGLIISRKIVKKLKSQAIAAQQSYSNMISYLDEALSGVRIIKAFNATNFIKNRFDNENVNAIQKYYVQWLGDSKLLRLFLRRWRLQ
jgi:subfamily B ATP-binding cassette protein MsbA